MMYDLTIPQKNIWNLQKFYEETSISNNGGAIFFGEKCEHEILNKAINHLIMHQDGMRLHFVEENGHPKQYIAEYKEQVYESQYFESHKDFEEYAQNYVKIPFQLIESEMYRFVIFDVQETSGVLLCVNHMISDAWAISIIAHTVAEAYFALVRGQDLDNQSYTYLSFIDSETKYLQSKKYEQDKEYWEKQYDTLPENSFIKPNSPTIVKPTAKRYTTKLPLTLAGEIDRYYSEKNVSQAVIFEAAMLAYMSRVNPENKSLSLGVPVLNRTGHKEKQAVGMCIATTPLTVSVAPQMTVQTLCKEITKKHFEIFRHQRFPYSDVLKNLHTKYGFEGNLYDVIVSFQNAKTGSFVKSQWFSNGYIEVALEVHIDNRDSSDTYTLNIDYQTELFEQEEIEFLMERIYFIIEQMIKDDTVFLDNLLILPSEESQKIVNDFNNTKIDFEETKCVHELFGEMATKYGEKVVLVYENEQFTYKELEKMSNVLAHFLREKGIGRGSVVPIISKRSWHVIVAMLGILKAGGAYMPVDPTYPSDRIDYMFETAGCRLALTYGYEGKLEIETISLQEFDFYKNVDVLENVNSPDDLCYVIFTSGSTGKPKGVSLCHKNVVNYCADNERNVCHSIIKPGERIVSVTNIIFDIFVTESILPLLNGITIYFANDEQVFSQNRLSKLISSEHIDVIQTTPTKMRSYIIDKNNLEYLKHFKAIVLGGEALNEDLYLELKKYTNADIFNIYGPAETTVWSTNKKVEKLPITIGKPIANTQVYIMDTKHRVLPIGVSGELCISGAGVGKGYLNRPDLTKEKFILNPFIEGETIYCTGDLARFKVDGEIEFLGRIDTQVKIRGLRIELGEIESVMNSFPEITLAAVADKKDESGRQYLVGYYIAKKAVDEKQMRERLSSKLPRYMIPNYLVSMEDMPMTASGKIDRKRLPMPEFKVEEREYVAPKTSLQRILCDILQELFRMEQIGITDHFFEMGGDSLRAIEFVSNAHNHEIVMTLQNVFDYPTVESLGDFLENKTNNRVEYSKEKLEEVEILLRKNVIRDDFVPKKQNLGNVFLTGATGFLGAHILEQFIKYETGNVYCLVRGGKERLLSVLQYYFGKEFVQENVSRIYTVDGDITREDLADELPENIQTVIHSAATVKHFGAYDYFYSINVQGTEHVMDFAKKKNAKFVHISTLSVSGNSLVDIFDVYRSKEDKDFKETSLYIGQPLDNVYIHSKFEAECCVLYEVLQGLDAKIVRVGNLTNRASDFKFQPNYQSNAFLNRIKAALELGALPDYLIPLYAEFSPIDQTAEGIIKIAQYAKEQNMFHLNTNKNLYFDRMVEILHELDVNIEVMDGESFTKLLREYAKQDSKKYIYEAFQNDMDEDGRLMYDSNIHIVNDFTIDFMKRIGFEWVDIDYAYVKGYLEYFKTLGYLKI